MISTERIKRKVATTDKPDLPWKMVSKGSRSSTRRTKKQAAWTTASPEMIKCSSVTTAEPEKLGVVSVLSQNSAEGGVEYVPIKKRRFMLSTPSPLKKSSCAHGEGSQKSAESNHSLPVSRLNPNLSGGKTAEETLDCGHDFSGIKILAEVACSSGMSSEIASVEDTHPVQQQFASTGNIVDSSGKDSTIESSDNISQGKSEVVVVPKQVDSLAADKSEDHMVASSGMVVAQNTNIAVSNESSTERPKEHKEASDSRNLATLSETVTVSGNLSNNEATGKGKNTECITDNRLLWDLNLPSDVWGQPCEEANVIAFQRYSDGEVTGGTGGHVDSTKNYEAELIASDVHMNSPSLPGPKAEASVRSGKECHSGYDDSQFEDGELREPYPWEENEGDSGDVEQVDYGSEPENERFYSVTQNSDNKLEEAVKCEVGNLREGSSDIEKHVVVCINDSRSKVSSPRRTFSSKPFKEFPLRETIPRRRYDRYEEVNEREGGLNKFFARDRTEMRLRSRSPPPKGQFGGWDSKRRFSPPGYRENQYGFQRPRPKTVAEGRVIMNNNFDQPGPAPGPNGYVRRQFSNGGGYRGRLRRFPDGGGNRDFRQFPPNDSNDYPNRVNNNRMNGRRERSISPPVFRRLHDHQSRSRSRSRSPVSWNGRNRSPIGFRNDDNNRVRFPFQKRFPVDQELGFMSPPRSQRNSRFSDGAGDNHYNNNFRGRKSPPRRMFRPEQRFDNNMRRVNSDNNNFRPYIRNNNNRRFVDGGGSRGFKYEGVEEENKNGNRYEMVHHQTPLPRRLEAMEEDGGGNNIRRFRLNTEHQQHQQQQHSVVSNKEEAS